MSHRTVLQHKLKDFRKTLGLNQTDFALSLGITQATIANMESGNREVSKPVLLKIKEVYNVDLLSFGEVKKHPIESNNVITIPFYTTKAAAGYGEALPDYPETDVIYFDARWLKNILGVNPANVAFIQAKGDSMDGGKHPIKDKDLLMIDESYKEPIQNQIFVINLGNNELVVKRVNCTWDGKIMLESNNPAYEPFLAPPEASIIGKVVWNGSKETV